MSPRIVWNLISDVLLSDETYQRRVEELGSRNKDVKIEAIDQFFHLALCGLLLKMASLEDVRSELRDLVGDALHDEVTAISRRITTQALNEVFDLVLPSLAGMPGFEDVRAASARAYAKRCKRSTRPLRDRIGSSAALLAFDAAMYPTATAVVPDLTALLRLAAARRSLRPDLPLRSAFQSLQLAGSELALLFGSIAVQGVGCAVWALILATGGSTSNSEAAILLALIIGTPVVCLRIVLRRQSRRLWVTPVHVWITEPYNQKRVFGIHEAGVIATTLESSDRLVTEVVPGGNHRRLGARLCGTAQAVVHFAGHGSPNGGILAHGVDGRSTAVSVARLASELSNAGCQGAVLNSCFSLKVAEELVARRAVRWAIGWPELEKPRRRASGALVAGNPTAAHACVFSREFYWRLSAGDDVRRAVEGARNGLRARTGAADDELPVLVLPRQAS